MLNTLPAAFTVGSSPAPLPSINFCCLTEPDNLSSQLPGSSFCLNLALFTFTTNMSSTDPLILKAVSVDDSSRFLYWEYIAFDGVLPLLSTAVLLPIDPLPPL